MELNRFVIGLILVVLVIFVGAIAAYGDDFVQNETDTSAVGMAPSLGFLQGSTYNNDSGFAFIIGGDQNINFPLSYP